MDFELTSVGCYGTGKYAPATHRKPFVGNIVDDI